MHPPAPLPVRPCTTSRAIPGVLLTRHCCISDRDGGCAPPAMPDWVNACGKYPAAIPGWPRQAAQRKNARTGPARPGENFEWPGRWKARTFRPSSEIGQRRQESKKPASEYARKPRVVSPPADQMSRASRSPEVWQDPRTGTPACTAVLPALASFMRAAPEIERLDAATANTSTNRAPAAGYLMKIGADPATPWTRKWNAWVSEIPAHSWTRPDARRARMELPPKIRCRSCRTAQACAGGGSDRSRCAFRFAAAVSGVAGGGISDADGEKPDYVLVANLSLEDLGLREAGTGSAARWEVTLRENCADRVRGSRR